MACTYTMYTKKGRYLYAHLCVASFPGSTHKHIWGGAWVTRLCLIMVGYYCCLSDGWWGENVGEGEGRERRGGAEKRRGGGGEKQLRRFLALRVESSHERAAVYSGDEAVRARLLSNLFATSSVLVLCPSVHFRSFSILSLPLSILSPLPPSLPTPQIYSSSSKDQRGIHVAVLNQATVCAPEYMYIRLYTKTHIT